MTDNKNNSANFQMDSCLKDPSGSSSSKLPNNFDDILGRLKLVFGVETDTDFARSMGFRQGAVSSAKQKQAIPPAWITEVAVSKGVSADWLLTGEGEMRHLLRSDEVAPQYLIQRPGRGLRGSVEGQTAGSSDELGDVENFDMGEVLAQTIDILNSKTVYTTAIVSNIKAFHRAITTEKKIEDMQEQLSQALASFSSFQAQLDKTNQIVSKLQSENEKLHQELEQSRAQSAVRDTG
jgi:hypothetical protein